MPILSTNIRLLTSMVFCLLVASCEYFTDPSESPTGWYMQREQHDDVTYYSIFFSDDNNGWIVGSSGTIKYSPDGGDTWISQSSGVSSFLWDVFFIDDQKGWACGANHTILRTLDGGTTWTNVSPPDTTDKIFLSIEFVSDATGWAATNHGELLKSTDGGLSWELKKQFSPPHGFDFIVFDSNTVYALLGRLYRTFNSGETWDTTRVSIPENYTSSGIFFSDTDHGWITTENAGGPMITEYPVIITTDGGMNWFLSDSLVGPGRCHYFINENIGWTASNQEMYKTINGGIHWTFEFAPENTDSGDMLFIDENLGWLLGYEGNIYKFVGPSL